MSGSRPPTLVEYALRRRWKLVVLATVLVGGPLAYLLAAMPATSYRVTQGYVVAGSDTLDDGPVTANSDRAARDYASVLRNDTAVVTALSEAASVSPGRVRDRLAVGYLPGAGTLFARYEAPERQEVLNVLGALDRVLVVDGVPFGGISPGQVRPLGLPAVERVPNRLNPFPGAGVVAALLAAVAGAVLLERMRPRVIDVGQLRQLTDRAVIELTEPDPLALLAFRLAAHNPEDVRVLALPAVSASAADEFAVQLGDAFDLLVDTGDLSGAAQGLLVSRATGVGLDATASASAWVLLVGLPAPMRPLVDALEALRLSPDVVLAVGKVDESLGALSSVAAA